MRARPDLWGEGLGNDPSYPAPRHHAVAWSMVRKHPDTLILTLVIRIFCSPALVSTHPLLMTNRFS